MGEEIQTSHFSEQDFSRYKKRLEEETALLQRWFREQHFAWEPPCAGFELEAWLVDAQLRPAPLNEAFLQRFDSPLASPELASFNIEVNSTPKALQGHVFSLQQHELAQTWEKCHKTAASLGAEVVMIGILPTLENEALTLGNMSQMERYRALNREVVRMRKGKPLVLDINGEEHLRVTHRDVMLESAATSFQIHLQTRQEDAVPFYNASIALSAPMVALAANSPFLFGKDLWAETRIPLFEQAVAVGGYAGAAFGPIRRVTFGAGYLRESMMECFQENLDHYPVMLPVRLDKDPEKLSYLRLHNGTIWRWNRPLIGWGEDGSPHLRIEHRVVPAGPSVVDAIANAAFFYGAVTALARQEQPLASRLEFDKARDNFYTAARLGLHASLQWFDGKQLPMLDLLREELLPLARQGLQELDIAAPDIAEYLGIIEQRIRLGVNGSEWQRAYVRKHGRDMLQLTGAYLERQNSGSPVHEWTV